MTQRNFRWPIYGHDAQARVLQESITLGNLAHAYIFYGPPQIGKRAVADSFIQSILCQGQDPHPCQRCDHCAAYSGGVHPDVFAVRPRDGASTISVEQIRQLQNQLYLRPTFASVMIGMVYDAQRLHLVAANALLKLLEEPPPNVIIVLVAHTLATLPATLISRCQLLKFRPLTYAAMKKWLSSQLLDQRMTKTVAALSMGRIGVAQSLIQDTLQSYHASVSAILTMFEGAALDRFLYIEKLVSEFKAKTGLDEGRDLIGSFLDYSELLLRDLLLVKISRELVCNETYRDRLQKLSKRFTMQVLHQLLSELRAVRMQLARHLNVQLALENYSIKIPEL